MLNSLLLGTLMILISVALHVGCLVWLSETLTTIGSAVKHKGQYLVTALVLSISVLVLIAVHTLEAWGWALLYLTLDEFSNLQDALYFSVVTATTLGYGDLTLSAQWQLLSTFEAMGGLILFGASTAFLLAAMRHVFDSDNNDPKP